MTCVTIDCLQPQGMPGFAEGLSVPLIRNQPAETTEPRDTPQRTLHSFLSLVREFLGAPLAIF